ncbi:MAG TPA: TadE family protein [Acidimicrobiales bacterium]|nr:TadE family protein [Acidimicrobiales bacterium]
MGQSRNTDERGTATLPLVLVVPAMLALILGGVQLGLWMHLQHVVTAAAQEGLVGAQVEGAGPAAGRRRAERFLTELAPPLLHERAVSAEVVGDDARVVVSGSVAAVVPGLRLQVRAVAEGPREAFRAP